MVCCSVVLRDSGMDLTIGRGMSGSPGGRPVMELSKLVVRFVKASTLSAYARHCIFELADPCDSIAAMKNGELTSSELYYLILPLRCDRIR